jgi:hypothetical protein
VPILTFARLDMSGARTDARLRQDVQAVDVIIVLLEALNVRWEISRCSNNYLVPACRLFAFFNSFGLDCNGCWESSQNKSKKKKTRSDTSHWLGIVQHVRNARS